MRSLAIAASLVVFVSGTAGCRDKSSPTDLAAQTAQDCQKLATLGGHAWSALDKDRCLSELGSVGPNLRECFHGCIEKAKTDDDWEDCKNECTGFVDHSSPACTKITTDGQAVDACVRRHAALESTKPEVYKCWARCGQRAKDAKEAAACDTSCAVPPP